MTDELCAREGCGAPKAWHDAKSTVAELKTFTSRNHRGNIDPLGGIREGWCLSKDCNCTAFLAPEPPKPERKAYVVEMDDEVSDFYRTYPGSYSDTSATQICHDAVPLADYLAEHPQPDDQLCICGGREDEHVKHPDGTVWCGHVARRWVVAPRSRYDEGWIERTACGCREYRPEAQP